MITEDYCSFEVAKLLKEKGFDEPCWNYYDRSKLEHYFRHVKNTEWTSDKTSAPTHQMALKWLMEVHGLFVKVGIGEDIDGVFGYIPEIYYLNNTITVEGRILPSIPADLICDYTPKTYEQAVESALLYTLKKLI